MISMNPGATKTPLRVDFIVFPAMSISLNKQNISTVELPRLATVIIESMVVPDTLLNIGQATNTSSVKEAFTTVPARHSSGRFSA
jgi:hypothetical protein